MPQLRIKKKKRRKRKINKQPLKRLLSLSFLILSEKFTTAKCPSCWPHGDRCTK